MKEKVVIFRETQCSHTLCIWFLSPPLYSNILARGGSLFRNSCLRNNQGRKSHNAVTAFPVILAHNHVREQGFPALRYSICARLRLYGKVR